MNDKAIRNILIAYLKASNHEIRIYQEKSIGTSICDGGNGQADRL